MKFIISILFISLSFSDSFNMQLVGHLPFDQQCSDITGFFLHGREIAVVGLYNGTAFVDITDPQNPLELQRISGDGSIWRDLKYWNNHVYIGTEASSGVQVVDVSELENIHLVHTITDFDNSHNIHVWNGYLFVIGADEHDIWIYDLSTPEIPTLISTWDGEYLHDIDVYNNKIYGMGIYTGTAYIIDILDITNPTTLISWNYPGMAHDAAVFHNEQFLATADEMEGGHIKIWDISDYNNIFQVSSFQVNSSHTVHNIYFKENLIIGSWYADGTRVLDVTDPHNPVEVGYYDTTELEGLYVGNWGTYTYLPSGLIISSDIESGLYIMEMGISISHTPNNQNYFLNEEIVINAEIQSFSGDISVSEFHYKDFFGDWEVVNLISCEIGESNYCATIPPINSATILNYYFYIENINGQSSILPYLGQNDPFSVEVGELSIIVDNDLESNMGWVVGDPSDDATAGIWEFGNPNGVYVSSMNIYSQPENDYSLDGELCFITGNSTGSSEGFDDVDGGVTSLISPMFYFEYADEIIFNFALWYSNNLGNNPASDSFNIEYRNLIEDSWEIFYSTNSSTLGWEVKHFYLSNYLENFNQIQFKFIASDLYYDGDNSSGVSLVEAGIDELNFKALYDNYLLGDANLDGNIDVTDVIIMVNIILGITNPSENIIVNSDLDGDGLITIVDIVSVVNIILF